MNENPAPLPFPNAFWGSFINVGACVFDRRFSLVVVVAVISGCAGFERPVAGPKLNRFAFEEKIFEQIKEFFRQEFPDTTRFPYPPVRLIGGPVQNLSISIPVPISMLAFYRHPFSKEFLLEKLQSRDSLDQMLADDIMNFRNGAGSRRYYSDVSYNGGKHSIQCVTFSVPWSQRSPPARPRP